MKVFFSISFYRIYSNWLCYILNRVFFVKIYADNAIFGISINMSNPTLSTVPHLQVALQILNIEYLPKKHLSFILCYMKINTPQVMQRFFWEKNQRAKKRISTRVREIIFSNIFSVAPISWMNETIREISLQIIIIFCSRIFTRILKKSLTRIIQRD